jgi:hypothetical protein
VSNSSERRHVSNVPRSHRGPSLAGCERPVDDRGRESVSIAIAGSSACHASGVGARAKAIADRLRRTSPGTMGEPEDRADAGPRPVAGRINLTPTAD